MVTDPLLLNIRHLRAMTEVARRGRLGVAAEQIGMTQPALTSAIAGLERSLGNLFVRTREGMRPNEAAILLSERVGEAYRHLAAALRPTGQRPRGFSQPENLVTTSQIRALLALAGRGSFVAAAQATALSQPALHRAVRDIERLTGVPMVERRGRGVALTDAGRKAARGFRLGLGALRAGLIEIAALEQPSPSDRLVIGAMPLCRARMLPNAIAAVQAKYPNTHVTIVEGAHRELIEQLRDGHIDMAIGALRVPSPGDDLVQHPLIEDHLVIVSRGGHPLAGPDLPSKTELARYPWLVGLPGSPLRDHWDRMFDGPDRPIAMVDCGSVMVLRALLIASDCLTLLSPEQVGLELSTGMLATVGQPLEAHVRTIGVTTRKDWRPTTAQRAMLTALQGT